MGMLVFVSVLVVVSLVAAWEGYKRYARQDFSSFVLAKRVIPGQEAAAARYFGLVMFALSAAGLSSLLLFVNPALKGILFVAFPACLIAIMVGIGGTAIGSREGAGLSGKALHDGRPAMRSPR